jgi:molybdopterin-binding protein
MAEYTMGEAAALLGVSPDTVRRWADAGRLATRRTDTGHRLVAGVNLARFASDVSGADRGTEAALVLSARNRFTGIVTAVEVSGVVASVELQAGPFRVVSIVTRDSVEELGLEPGVLATAVVKATSVMIEAGPPARSA